MLDGSDFCSPPWSTQSVCGGSGKISKASYEGILFRRSANWAKTEQDVWQKKNNKERDKSFERHLESIFRCIKDKVYKTRFNPNYLKKPSEAQTGAIPKTTTFHFGCAKTGSRCELCLRNFPNSCVFVCVCVVGCMRVWCGARLRFWPITF